MMTSHSEGDAKEWFNKNKDNIKNFDKLKEGLINQCKDTKELILQKIFHAKMEESESVDKYVNRFSDAVAKCLNYCGEESNEQDINLKYLLNMVGNLNPLTAKRASLSLSSEIERILEQEE